MPKIVPLYELLKEGVEQGVFPGTVSGIYFEGKTYILSAGYASITPFLEPMEEDLLFDLASLTKPLALGLVLMDLMEKGYNIDLEKPLGEYIEIKEPLSRIPLFRFLNHTSGLKAWYPFYERGPLTLEEVTTVISSLPLEYPPGTNCLYSDLNFFLLTYFLEKFTQKNFENLFNEAIGRIAFERRAHLLFKPLEKGIDQEKIVPTSYCKECKKILRGLVEDENTRALGGVSGVAGLFGNIYGVIRLLTALLDSYLHEEGILKKETIRPFFEFKESLSEYTLIFMRQSSKGYSATGGVFSPNTVGHLGYTGCSFFMDLDRGLVVVLLTNRVHPFRGNELIRDFRPLFHRKVMECFKG